MSIISCILGRLSWSDGSWPVDFSLDVDLECNLERILKGLLHWPFFVGHITGRRCRWQVLYVDSLLRAPACGITGTRRYPSGPGLEEFREGSSKLAEEC